MTSCEPLAIQEQLPIAWRAAVGSTVWDDAGKAYIDFTSGIFVANVGHAHPRVMSAIRGQLDGGPLLHSYTFPNVARTALAERLTRMTGFEKCSLMCTGSEAVEAALRVARGRDCYEQVVVAWPGSMHGKTRGSAELMGGGQCVIQAEWPSDTWWFPYHCKNWRSVAAIIIESYHGWGALFYPKQYVQDVAQWCKDNGALLIFDEVQAGFGRTGKLFAYEHYGVEPDLVCCGKGMGGGLPVSALLGSAELLDSDDSLTSTHGGNPICCAAANEALSVIEDEHLVERAAELVPHIYYGTLWPKSKGCLIHGKGMVWAIWMNDNPRFDPEAIDKANRVVELAAERGLLLLKTGAGTIKIGPPLTIPLDQLNDGLGILEGCLKEVL